MQRASVLQVMRQPHTALSACLLASLMLLLGAFAFEYIGGLAPCKLCIWQRWPHALVIVCAGIGLARTDKRLWLTGTALSALTTSGIGLYHLGVEQKWWSGPSGCSSQMGSNLDLSELTDSLLAMPVVKCDEVAWELLGLSMAGWNMVLSAGIALIAFQAIRPHHADAIRSD